METINVVGYVRTSPGARQGEQTLQKQIINIEEFCQDKGYTLLAIYRDENVAAHIPFAMRPGGSLLLTASAHQGIKALVICSHCRLGRDIGVNEEAVRELYDERGIEIWNVTQDVDASTTVE